MSVYIDSLEIAGIMGVPNEVELNFTAPLTLIYAPNGTGKTSAWTAVKALMTNGISDGLVCRSAKSKPPKIVGQFLIGKSKCTLTASAGGVTLTSEDFAAKSGYAALSALAPEVDTALLQTKGGVLKDRLISQIEGCRFLPAESLLYLIDNGDESTELRRKLFADLTGTSAIQSEVRESNQYREKLLEELGRGRNSLKTIEEQMQAFSSAHNTKSSDSLRLIEQAATIAEITLPVEMSAHDALALLRDTQGSWMAILEKRQSAYNTWRSIEATYPNLNQDLTNASNAMNQANVARDAAQGALAIARSKLESGDFKRAKMEHQRFQRGLEKLAALVATEGRTPLLTESTIESLRQLLLPFDSEPDIETKLGALQQLNDFRQTYQLQTTERQNLIDKQRKFTSELKSTSGELLEEIGRQNVRQLDLVTRINRQSDLAASLRASAQSLVSASQLVACPCCSHHWKSVDALLAAIASGDRTENTDPRLKSELATTEAAIELLQSQYLSTRSTEDMLRGLERKLGELNASIERIERLAVASVVALPRLLDATTTLQEVRTLSSRLEFWRIIKAADDLAWGLDETKNIDAALSTLSTRNEALKAAATLAEQSEIEQQLLVAREQNSVTSNSELAIRQESEKRRLVNIKQSRDAAIDNLSASGSIVESIVKASLDQDTASLEKLGNLVTQISAAIEASAAVAARERITENQKTLQSMQNHIQLEADRATELIGALTAVEKQSGDQFFEKLFPAVGTLFDHMQVNRVFRGLEISSVKQSFHLEGQLDDGVSLDPGTHFSQGQRQDLALSMFLVRAASLGGSFFLDEPLAHLDDLNRTALLDCLRACVLGTESTSRPVRLVVTTANWSVARHLMQKFHNIRHPESSPTLGPWLRVIQLSGNVRQGIEQNVIFPVEDRVAAILH